MKRLLVISDIHGELTKFEQLLEQVSYDPDGDQLILLGDYIDRGPDPKAVVEKVMRLKNEGALVLKGNHDDMMEKAFEDPNHIKRWVRNGGIETLKSYGYRLPKFRERHLDQWVAKISPLTAAPIVKKHLAFFKNLDHYHETEDFIFVHGGVDPATPLAITDPFVLMWIREEFHNGYNGEKTVVFGHTPTDAFHDGFNVHFGANNIIGIDGGCVFGGRLNCLELPSRNIYFVE